MIERLVISRFRGIRKGVLKDFGKFNLLVGQNNSGKTAVLEVLYWLSVCGRKCRVLPERSGTENEMAMVDIGFDANIPIKKDVSGYSPCPNIWERHGKPEKWYKPPGDVINQGFRIITPQDQEIIDNNKLMRVDLENNCVFVSDQTEGMGDIIKYYFPDLFPDSFSFSEEKERRYAFMWFQDFINQGKSLGAWGIEGKSANADCVLFYDFHATSRHFEPDIIGEKNKIPYFERRLKESFSNVFPIGDFEVSIGHYPDNEGAIQGIINQTEYLFSWDEIPGNDSVRLIDFLKYKFSIEWIKTAKIEKIDNCMTIKVSTEKNFLLLKLNNEKTKLSLEIDDVRIDELIAKKENDKLNIHTEMRPVPIDDFGDGARHAFKVLAALTVLSERCKFGKEGIFLWEDPELFMHQSTIGKLLEEIAKIVKDKPIQVFISTQSLEVLAYSARMIEKNIYEKKDVRTYTLNLKQGELTARKFWGTALSDWLSSGFDPRLLDISEDELPITWHLKKKKNGDEMLW
jgi:hypothetical protein